MRLVLRVPAGTSERSPIQFNGIDAASGDDLFARRTVEELARLFRWNATQTLQNPASPGTQSVPTTPTPARALPVVRFGETIRGVKPEDPRQAGWGIVFPARPAVDIEPALRELWSHRDRTTGGARVFKGENGCRLGESGLEFLTRFGAAPGGVDPDQLPYYLLLVASPQEISFEFQRTVGQQRAVGRLDLDSLEAYERYAQTVVQAETGRLPARRNVSFFAPGFDDVTRLSQQKLVSPLANDSTAWLPGGFTSHASIDQAASKHQLLRHLGGDLTPAILFSASHGLGHVWNRYDPWTQGAVVCHAPSRRGAEVSSETYVAAGDIPDHADIRGLIHFAVGCFTAGTPDLAGSYWRQGDPEPPSLAPRPHVSMLSRRLLGHPNGTALAFIGHIDRAWSSSFRFRQGTSGTFRSVLHTLTSGVPVGQALHYMRVHFGELASVVAESLVRPMDDLTLVLYQTAFQDAYNYILLGDPAVRVPGTF